ncbi:MAG: nitroreductase family protein [Oceanococcus sp.]
MSSYQAPPLPTIDVEEFRKVVTTRRSVRRFTEETIPDDVVNDCLDMALLAPNSSNLQPWDFYRIVSPEKKKAMGPACLNQNAAKTAAELIVVCGRTRSWKKHSEEMLNYWPEETVPRIVEKYYKVGAKAHYGNLPLDPFGRLKKLIRDMAGIAGPTPRWPNNTADMRLWACKTAALGAQNLMLSFRAHGYDTCPMEGFDDARVRKIVKLPRDAFIVMVIAAGRRAENGLYHQQFRFERERFVHEV